MIQPLDQSIIVLLNASRDDEETLAFPSTTAHSDSMHSKR